MSVDQDWSDALSNLTPGFLDFIFSSCKDAEARIDKFIRGSLPSQYAVIRQIPLKEFEKLDECYQTHSRIDYFRYIELAVLYLKMPSVAHNMAFTRIKDLFAAKALTMGISLFDYVWLSNLTHRGQRRTKEPDECFFPTRNVQAGDWPVLVVEAGVSETIGQLHRDAVWWFCQRSEVKYVLLVNLDTITKTITIEKWERARQPSPLRPVTRSRDTLNNPLEPMITESVVIDQSGVIGSLRLSFSTLFNRQPGPSEHDFQFGAELDMLWAF